MGLVADPDGIVEHVPVACCWVRGGSGRCAAGGCGAPPVHDMPAIAPPAVEHRLHWRRCGCGQVTGAAAPAGVNAPASYRPNAELGITTSSPRAGLLPPWLGDERVRRSQRAARRHPARRK